MSNVIGGVMTPPYTLAPNSFHLHCYWFVFLNQVIL